MEKLSHNDHYKILQEAMMKNRDPEMKIVCGDGVYVVNSAHFKLASSFWMKLLGAIPESNSYVLITPDISVQSISHIGKYYGSSYVKVRPFWQIMLLLMLLVKLNNIKIVQLYLIKIFF